jgi:ATP-dependent helicase HrpB
VSRTDLPIDEIVEPLLRALRSSQAVVVEAPPGAGKTTRLPRVLLEAGAGGEREIWVAEPQRVVALLAAHAVARQLGENVGQRVGYETRFERRVGPESRLRFVADQVLLERLASTERGTGIGTVVLDDFQERSVASDLSLMLLRRRLAGDAGLRIIILSSTGENSAAESSTSGAGDVVAYLGHCPRLRCGELAVPGQIEHTAAGEAAEDEARPLYLRVARQVERLVREVPHGDILAFLPDSAEIERTRQALHVLAEKEALDLLPLHEDLPFELAARATVRGPRRRVVLATRLAEASIGVPTVSLVVDSGLRRSSVPSLWSDRRRFELRPIARSSAQQRAACARGEGARIVRSYTEESLRERPAREEPELQRLDLAAALLTLYGCKVPLTSELWLDAPSELNRKTAHAQLERLGLASGARVTDLGRRALALQVPPRLARVALEGAELGIPRRACLAVALLAEGEIRADAAAPAVFSSAGSSSAAARGTQASGAELRSLDSDSDSDIEHLSRLYAAAEAGRFAPAALLRLGLRPDAVEAVRRTYEQLLGNITARHPVATEEALDANASRRALGLAFLAAFPERVAGRREIGKDALILSTGQSAQLAPESVAHASPFLIVLDAEEIGSAEDGQAESSSQQLRVRIASPLEPEWLIEHAPAGLSERELLDWDDEAERAILITQLCWGEVVLRQSVRLAYPGLATGTLVERAALAQLGTLFVKADGLPELVARSELVAQHLPQLGLQAVNELGTRGLLRAACTRVISIAELRELDWGTVFLEQLSPEQRRELERQAPEHVVLAGGRRLRVRYARGQAPFIECLLQDFFGMQAGPALVGGRVPLTLHLLAPNQRAVQVTADLAEFWERHYADLRRELSRRYPRHPWPENPRTATAPPPNKQF